MTRVFAVSDIHGHLEKLTAALHVAGLTDADGNWAGADVRLWFLGDFFDRGPDGIGVLRFVRGLIDQAPDGAVRMLLGNHEILALGMYKFGDTFVPHDGLTLRSFERSWALNGGQDRDQELLTDDDVAWLLDRPMLGLDADQLLMHSDTAEYVEWGDTIDQINGLHGVGRGSSKWAEEPSKTVPKRLLRCLRTKIATATTKTTGRPRRPYPAMMLSPVARM